MKPRIFISAVTSEFGATRQLVANVLLRLGYDPVTQDIFGTESGDLRQVLRAKIDDCDGLIQLVGRGYGAEPPTVGTEFAQDGFIRVSYTQFEFLYARARGKKTWLIFTDDGCTLDHPLEELDLPSRTGAATNAVADAASVGSDAGSIRHDQLTHPDPAGYQSERRALQESWRQRWKQEGHLRHAASSDTELELKVERLKDEFADLRRAEHAWRRTVAWSMAAIVVVVTIVLVAVGSIRWQQQVEREREEIERLAQRQEREDQERERQNQENERLAADAARQQVQQIEQIEQEFAARFLHQLLANKEISAEDARQRALKELPALVNLPLEEVLAIIDRKMPVSTPEAPVSPLERARTALAQGKYDDVFQAANDQRQEGRELAMLEGTAALARFRESPKPEWNERALAAFRRALALSEKESNDWTDAAIKSAGVLHDLARYAEAEQMLVEAQRILEDKYGRESPEVPGVLNNLAQLLKDTNRLTEAEPVMRRALAIFEQSFGAQHPNVATSLNNLAHLFQDTNRLAEAEPLMRRALAIDEKSYGAEHPKVAIDLNNLASLLKDTNRLTEAEPLMRRGLAIDEQSYGAGHPKVANFLNNLAQLLKDTNRLTEAEPLLRRALAINEQSFGAQHPNVATSLNNLAHLFQDTNRLEEAEPLLRRALAIDEKSHGAEHPSVAIALNNLSALLMDTNRLAEAEPLMRRALAIDEQSYGAEHPTVAIFLNNLAQLLKDTNRLAEAEPLTRRCVAIFHQFGRMTGHDHPSMQTVLWNYHEILQAIKLPEDEIAQRVKEATAITGQLNPILPEVERLLGPAKPVADVLAGLNRQYKADGKPAVYFLLPDQPLAPHLDELLQPNAESLTAAGVRAFRKGDHANAIAYYEESLKLLADSPDKAPITFMTRMNRSSALRELGEVEQARDELRRLLSGDASRDTISALAQGRARYHLALCEWILGDRDAAQREVVESLKVYGDDDAAVPLKQQTEQLLADLNENKPLPPLAKVDAVAALEQARVRFRARADLATLPLNQSAVPLLDQMLGPASSTKEVFETLDRQYREQGKPAIWFLPLSEPISPHLDELLGPIPVAEEGDSSNAK